MTSPPNPSQEDIEAPITTAPPEVERIIREVIRLEKDNLGDERSGYSGDQRSRYGIRGDVLKIIKDIVQ
jgi:hypothetical protein